jgi:transposase-like protein
MAHVVGVYVFIIDVIRLFEKLQQQQNCHVQCAGMSAIEERDFVRAKRFMAFIARAPFYFRTLYSSFQPLIKLKHTHSPRNIMQTAQARANTHIHILSHSPRALYN